MPKLALTQAAVAVLPIPSDSSVTHWDTHLAGFGVRVSPKGRKTYIAQYRVTGGREVVETIGTTHMLPKVADARERARVSLLQAKGGIDPVAERKRWQAAETKADEAQALTFEKLAASYTADYLAINCKPSSAAQTSRLLQRASRFLGDKPVHTISKADILELISQPPLMQPSIARVGGRSEQTNLLKAVRRLLRWAIERDLIDRDPTLGVRKPLTRQADRERVLNDDEIVRFWRACDSIGYPYGPLFQLLLVTGQRRCEVGDLPWVELDLKKRVWHLPKERAKNSKAHDIHLSGEALAIIDTLPRIAPLAGKPDWLFTLSGERPVGNFSRAKAQLDALMSIDDRWTLHDLRRTATTIMARLKVPPHVADKVLNHKKGTIGGVAGIYNRFQYRDEREEALDTLGRFVTALVHPETAPDNVVALRSA
jgi:integrase